MPDKELDTVKEILTLGLQGYGGYAADERKLEKQAIAILQPLLKQAELEAKLELYKGWLNWVESGGGQVDRTKIRENIAELEAEMGEK